MTTDTTSTVPVHTPPVNPKHARTQAVSLLLYYPRTTRR